MATNFLTKLFGSRNDRLLKQYRRTVEQINAFEPKLEQLSDAALPLAKPALAAAWILVFLPAATELTMSVLLAGPHSSVLGSTNRLDFGSYAPPSHSIPPPWFGQPGVPSSVGTLSSPF